MLYHAVRGRCVLDFKSFCSEIPRQKVLMTLATKGFQPMYVDMFALARAHIGASSYRRCVLMREAPQVVDCASLIKWMYGERGIWLPRDFILWLDLGLPVEANIVAGDLIFTDGYCNRMVESVSIGHVAIATDRGTIIHATNRVGIQELPTEKFFNQRAFRLARRIAQEPSDLVTLAIPPDQEVETSDDIKWILFDALKETSMARDGKL